jgi:ABC-type uncharacterized transport system substrate-binding protein
MKRREFITLLGGATAWPGVARSQRSERGRRIGVFMNLTADDPEAVPRIAAFMQGLQEAGWKVGQNLRIDHHWAQDDSDRRHAQAAELIALKPDAILASGATAVGPLQRATRSIPIVFVQVTDPVGAGFVASLARPGGNITGFTTFEYGIGAKWLELLKEIAPRLEYVAVLRNPSIATGIGLFGAMQSAAFSLGLELRPVDARDAGEIERALHGLAAKANRGLIVLPLGPSTSRHRALIIALAARLHLPALYPFGYLVSAGGLLSYGPETLDPYRRAAAYVDRILRGEKPDDLPVQASTKFELAINLKTAKALGLDVPPTLLALADEVIE